MCFVFHLYYWAVIIKHRLMLCELFICVVFFCDYAVPKCFYSSHSVYGSCYFFWFFLNACNHASHALISGQKGFIVTVMIYLMSMNINFLSSKNGWQSVLNYYIFFKFFLPGHGVGQWQESCQWEEYEASCGENEVIVMAAAKYGQMEVARCVDRLWIPWLRHWCPSSTG